MADEDRFRELEDKYEGFKVYDNSGDSIGKVDDLFVDEGDREQYIGVKMGLFGLSGTTLIPLEIVRVNQQDRVIEVDESKERVKDAPHYRDDDEIDQSFEARIREHFGIGGATSGSSYGDRPTDSSGAEGTAAGDNTARGGDFETSESGSREAMGREEYRNSDNYVSDSAMASGASGGAASGGVSDFETGEREYSEREGRGEYREGESETSRQGGQAEGSSGGMSDDKYNQAYMEGYREAIRESSGQAGGASGSTGAGQGQGGRSGDREGAGEHFGAPVAEPGEREFQDTQDYESASTGYQPGRGEGGSEGDESRTRVRRLRRDS